MNNERKQAYECVYNSYNNGKEIRLDEIKLINEAKLYKVDALLSKGFPYNHYYIVAFDKKEAKEKFLGVLSYMKIVNIEELDEDKTEVVLKNIRENCVLF